MSKRMGSNHHHAKLTEADIPDILRAVASGESRSAVARRYRVNHSVVVRIVSGESWGHVERPEGLDLGYVPKHRRVLAARINQAGRRVDRLRREMARAEALQLKLQHQYESIFGGAV